jgi:hypothetical protein
MPRSQEQDSAPPDDRVVPVRQQPELRAKSV